MLRSMLLSESLKIDSQSMQGYTELLDLLKKVSYWHFDTSFKDL